MGHPTACPSEEKGNRGREAYLMTSSQALKVMDGHAVSWPGLLGLGGTGIPATPSIRARKSGLAAGCSSPGACP